MSYRDQAIGTRPYFLTCSCGLVAELGIGLFSGAILPLALHFTPPFPAAAKAAEYDIKEFRKSLDKPLIVLGTISSLGFALAYTLAPAKSRHPYLIYAAVLSTIATWKWDRISSNAPRSKLTELPDQDQPSVQTPAVSESASGATMDKLKSSKDKYSAARSIFDTANSNTSGASTSPAGSTGSSYRNSSVGNLGNDLRVISACSLTAFTCSLIGTIFRY